MEVLPLSDTDQNRWVNVEDAPHYSTARRMCHATVRPAPVSYNHGSVRAARPRSLRAPLLPPPAAASPAALHTSTGVANPLQLASVPAWAPTGGHPAAASAGRSRLSQCQKARLGHYRRSSEVLMNEVQRHCTFEKISSVNKGG